MEDNYSLWKAKTGREEAWLEKQPVCCHCGHHIQEDDLYDVFGNLYHEDCHNECFRRHTEEYID